MKAYIKDEKVIINLRDLVMKIQNTVQAMYLMTKTNIPHQIMLQNIVKKMCIRINKLLNLRMKFQNINNINL